MENVEVMLTYINDCLDEQYALLSQSLNDIDRYNVEQVIDRLIEKRQYYQNIKYGRESRQLSC